MALNPHKFDPKPVAGSDFFFFDWTDWIKATPGEAINLSAVQVDIAPAGAGSPVVSDITVNGYVVRCRISGGKALVTYTVTCTITTVPGLRKDSASSTLYIVH